MNDKTLKNKEKDTRKCNTSEALNLSNDFSRADGSPSEVLDIKKILSIQSNLAEMKKNLVNNKNNTYFQVKHQEVNVSCCRLTEIPSVIFSLKYLTVLNLSNNFLDNLPKEIGGLCNLLTLKLSGNKLKCLPKSLKNVQHLNYLDLSCNKFTEVPEVLYHSLRALKILDLSCNEIRKFNDPPACLNKLVALGVSDNYLKWLPLWVFDNLCALQVLDISKNHFCLNIKCINYSKSGIYESLQLMNMENCNLSCKNLESLSAFKKLKVLHLGNGKMASKIPKGKNYMGNLNSNLLINFQEITNLNLQNVQIATLPTDFSMLKNIEELNLSSNLLSWLPECFCELVNLKILYLTSNQLLFLPANIGKLTSLKQVHLGNNKLYEIPESFYNLTNLEYVDFYNNEIEKVEPKIFKEKKLKGIDLGLNCLVFDFCSTIIDIDEIKMLYSCLQDSFRKYFCYSGSRCDLQMIKFPKGVSESSSDSHSGSNQCSASSFESEQLSDLENSFLNVAQPNHTEDDDWGSHKDEEDELFDPNEINLFQRPHNNWRSDFQNNYCPANYHAPSVMKTFIRNFMSASKNENVEDGQFDSD